jgi:hypothetical protein
MRCLVLLVTGCGAALLRAPGPEGGGSPRIDRLVDLGSLPVAWKDDTLDTSESDGVFFPGEHVAVIGGGLHSAELAVDGAPAKTVGYLRDGSVIVRLPGSLAPMKGHRITAGDAVASFDSSLYVIASDTDGNRVRFVCLGGDPKRVADPDLSIAQSRALFHAVSPDAAFVYSLALHEKRGMDHDAEVLAIHLGAKGKPKTVSELRLAMKSHPTGITFAPDGTLVVLGNRELITVDVTSPAAPALLGRIELSDDDGDRHVEMLFRGTDAVLLEASDNRVRAVSIADPRAPKLGPDLLVGPAEDFPFSVDLVPDPRDPKALYVLQGLNLRLGGKKVEEGKGSITGLVRKGYDLVRGKSVPEAEKPAFDVPKRARLVRVAVGPDAITKGEVIELPDELLPLFGLAADDAFYVSGVAPGALDANGLDASIDGAARVLGFLKDSAQMGKIAKVTRDGKTEIVLQGVAMIFDIDRLPTGKIAYSGMRLSGRLLPPFVGVSWGVGFEDGLFYALHDLEYDYFMPPYTYGQVSVQRGL